MAKELTGLGKFTVWVLVPILVGVIGYAYIGPRVGGIGAKVPVVRKLGRELANKVRKPAPSDEEASTPTQTRDTNAPAENAAPASGGATEFQRVRQEAPRSTAPRVRRTPLDRVD